MPQFTNTSLSVGTRLLSSAAVAVLAFALSGCSTTPTSDPTVAGAPQTDVVDPASIDTANGDAVICGLRDSGVYTTLTDAFNARDTGVTASYVELAGDTDTLRAQSIQRLEGGSAECDIYMMDVTWVNEWATQGWILDQTQLVEANTALIESTANTAFYDGRYWATPFFTNAGLLYYRTDRVSVPTTWEQVYAEAASDPANRIVMQGQAYEGLTVNFLELLYSAGGDVLGENGEILIDSDAARKALALMADGVESGAIDRASLTFNEDGSRRAYESGNAGYQRNWPNVYSMLQQLELGAVTAVAPLPAFDDNSTPVATLGGWNMAVAASSQNIGAAAALIEYASSTEFQKLMVLTNSQAPVIEAVYNDPDVQAAIPFATALKNSVLTAKPRPKSPVYPQISAAIYSNVYEAMSGRTDVDSAITKMADDIASAQDTF